MAPTSTRFSQLAGSWYPNNTNEIKDLILSWESYIERVTNNITATPDKNLILAVVPHAGWVFSGRLAASAFQAAKTLMGNTPPETIVILGGHTPPGAPLITFTEDSWETPLGNISLTPWLNQEILALNPKIRPIHWQGPTNDNTIEVELPLIKYYFPEAKVWAIRPAPDKSAFSLGNLISKHFGSQKTLVVASTDLTHYGETYDFAPKGTGPEGMYFRDQNDKAFIKALLDLDLPKILTLGNEKLAACSAGAAATVAAIAKENNYHGELLGHYGSESILPSRQSVGYAGLVFY
ncbi:MAG: AmmeMemoRadiSam system protein B [Deltaproteobacteria bacterium]|jgi:AmmeMemoRadiSam system protein B|nr:AmmeMemoRadiSam system protein B [Deltaproteobacteria bacterium]